MITIVDFGSQYNQNIARRVRELGVFSEVVPYHKALEEIARAKPEGVILTGGPKSVHDADAPKCSREILELDVPLLGICYGMQFMADTLGGEVIHSDDREYGPAELTIEDRASELFRHVPETGKKTLQCWTSHGDRVSRMPDEFRGIASSTNSEYAAMTNNNGLWAVQFHPEVDHTEYGREILKGFVYGVCNATKDWTTKEFIDNAIEAIRKEAGGKKVVCGVSGGVDSTVMAALTYLAVGGQAECISVDNGLLRQGDLEYVNRIFRTVGIPLHIVDASDTFFGRLDGVVDPEEKRKIIGNTFIEVFRDRAKELGINPADAYFAQGTLYPDVIESVPVFGGPTSTIKSHHNVGGLPEKLGFIRLIEPLKYLFKDEVREVGEQLAGAGYISVDRGTWHEILWRHPFPGPSLAIRLPDQAVTREKVALLRKVDNIVVQELKTRMGKGRRGTRMYDEIWQAVIGLLDVKTVGVMGDERTHESTAVMRFVVSNDGMTASTYDFPPGVLSEISAKIVNSVKGVNRVFTDHTPKPPGTIEFE